MARWRTLHVGQPAQRAQADFHRLRVVRPSSAENQRVRQLGVVVGDIRLEPGPVVGRVLLVQLDQPGGERVAMLVHQPIAAHAAEVFVNADQRECPGPRRRGFDDRVHGRLEQLGRPRMKRAPLRAADARADRPRRAADGIVRAGIFQPLPVEAHEIAEAAALRCRTRNSGTPRRSLPPAGFRSSRSPSSSSSTVSTSARALSSRQ